MARRLPGLSSALSIPRCALKMRSVSLCVDDHMQVPTTRVAVPDRKGKMAWLGPSGPSRYDNNVPPAARQGLGPLVHPSLACLAAKIRSGPSRVHSTVHIVYSVHLTNTSSSAEIVCT